MKKRIISLWLSIAAVCALTAACSCGGEQSSSSSSSSSSFDSVSESQSSSVEELQEFTVTFVEDEGFTFEGESLIRNEETDEVTATVTEGESISFTLKTSVFYTGNPSVVAGDVALSAADGVYTLSPTESVEVKATGIHKEVSSMLGSGAFDDAFVVTRPIDLLHIAEQVNAGNNTYRTASYVLAADIDCGGEELQVIGDLRNEEAFFSGCFTCVTNSETGEMERYSIKNFTINSTDKNYVGLFGCVQADLTTQSSGLFYGIRLEDFVINAGVDDLPSNNKTVYCGSLIGYGVGVTSYLCDAVNGEINVAADPNYFSFAGGLMGVQQGHYAQEYGRMFLSEIAYATVDVNVTSLRGLCLYGGGIVGFAYTNSLVAPAFIHTSYSIGSVRGAIRAGGIAGGLGQHSSIAGSYAAGTIVAESQQSSSLETATLDYCYAYAGGLVGYAENDTIVNDCFFSGKVFADAKDGEAFESASFAVAGGDKKEYVSVTSQKYEVQNCLEIATPTNLLSTLRNQLGWQAYNWVLANDAYPTINYESSEETVRTTITVEYVRVNKNGDTVTTTPVKVADSETDSFAFQDSYAPIVDAFNNGDLDIYLTADDNKLLSYGYYFDKACTQPVPFAFVTTKDVTLYIGFKDPAAIVGEYLLGASNADSEISLTVQADGIAVYDDGVSKKDIRYQYNGELLTLEGARLAQYYLGAVDSDLSVNKDTTFDLNRYTEYYFLVSKQDNGDLIAYDGVYFTKDAPLTAYKKTANVLQGKYYTVGTHNVEYVFRPDGTGTSQGNSPLRKFNYSVHNGVITLQYTSTQEQVNVADLKTFDAFKGTWSKSATVNKFYTFDGMGKWTYQYLSYERKNGTVSENVLRSASGEYTVLEGTTLSFTHDGVAYTVTHNATDGNVTFTANGTNATYYRANGYKGVWTTNGLTLTLNGINRLGLGTATAEYDVGVSYPLTYQASQTDGVLCLYTDGVVFGYLRYNLATNSVSATVFDPMNMDTGYTAYALLPVYDYDGEWISNKTELNDIAFNGVGSYNADGNWEGEVVIDGTTSKYVLQGSTLEGWFIYNGVRYTLSLNEDTGIIHVSYTGGETVLERKDEFAGLHFIDERSGKSFAFDGKGNLNEGGTITVSANEKYTYKRAENGYDVFSGTQNVGSLTNEKTYYKLTVNGVEYSLYLKNDLMGEWAVSGEFTTFTVKASTIQGDVRAYYKGVNFTLSYLNSTTLQGSAEFDGMPVTYYVFLIYNANNTQVVNLAISEYASLNLGGYSLCAKRDNMYGVWKQADSNDINVDDDFMMRFDGLQSDYGYGIAQTGWKNTNHFIQSLTYYYRIYDDGSVLIWSQSPSNGTTLYYQLKWCAANTPGAYIKEDGSKAFVLKASDSLYYTKAKDENGVVYTFDGNNVGTTPGVLSASNGKKYAYIIREFTNDKKAIMDLVEIGVNNPTTYKATLSYGNVENITITLETAETDALSAVEAVYNEGIFSFDGAGTATYETDTTTTTYTYVLSKITESKWTVALTDTATQAKKTLTLDFSNNDKITATLA